MGQIISLFEEKLKSALNKAGVTDSSRVGVAVSGGADSISLLYSLSRVLKKENLFAVTVNHNIRKKEETEGDALFVQERCSALGVECRRYDIERGLIEKTAVTMKTGMEEAARRKRYEIFSSFINEYSLDFLCLAHNLDDFLETMLMNFMRGTSVRSMAGIPFKRDKYIRPLLQVRRFQIEEYLSDLGVPFRTDSTNSDSSYFRNAVRNKLVPFLDAGFPSWRNGLLRSGEKLSDVSDALDFMLSDGQAKDVLFLVDGKEKKAELSYEKLILYPKAVRNSFLLEAVSFVGSDTRISYDFLSAVPEALKKDGSCVYSSGLDFLRKEGKIHVSKALQRATEKGFFVIIEESGFYEAGELSFSVEKTSGGILLSCRETETEIKGLEFPFCVKNPSAHEKLRLKDGTFVPSVRVLESLASPDIRKCVPVVVPLSDNGAFECMECACIWGKPFGLKNRFSHRMETI